MTSLTVCAICGRNCGKAPSEHGVCTFDIHNEIMITHRASIYDEPSLFISPNSDEFGDSQQDGWSQKGDWVRFARYIPEGECMQINYTSGSYWNGSEAVADTSWWAKVKAAWRRFAARLSSPAAGAGE